MIIGISEGRRRTCDLFGELGDKVVRHVVLLIVGSSGIIGGETMNLDKR